MIRDLVRGGLGGVVATAAMSVVMVAGDRAGLMRDQPPKRIIRAFLPGGRHRPEPGEGVLAAVAHVGFGAACGALFGLLARGRRPPVPAGVGYGLAIWLAGYQGWVPALGVLPPISRDRPGRVAVMGAGHVVYGAALAAAVGNLNRDRPDRG
ncbi:DUF6789 family protein [Planomonospora venezuelensis]|uniref:DUF1440 domain-containing protein n=1 Tax=Planomonospora venezuelensis TaxID=1999 RepID=A0A841DDA4_PLAVE|nr:DUF6789 family protein [Planomonospora venezuelensis]MBB5968101.1 hypothetical protein [Planomonospora venezuelensis]GIN04350.1 hypothetical protein Pve01_60080 [Planomonospora venezuelensis]